MARRVGGIVNGAKYVASPTYAPIIPVLTIKTVSNGIISQFDQGTVITLSTSPDPIISVTIGGVVHGIASQSLDSGVRTVILDRVEALGASGTKVVEVDDGTSTATKNVSYVQTHPYAAPAPGDYDSNSLFVGSEFPGGSYFKIMSGFHDLSFKSPYTSFADSPLENDINDYLQSTAGFTGAITFTLQIITPDGDTASWVVDVAVEDTIAPAGYSLAIDQTVVTNANRTSTSFTMAGAEIGSSLVYTITSDGGAGSVSNSGSPITITEEDQQITGIDVTSLPDGNLTYSVVLTDHSLNAGVAATDTVAKDTVAPSLTDGPTLGVPGQTTIGIACTPDDDGFRGIAVLPAAAAAPTAAQILAGTAPGAVYSSASVAMVEDSEFNFAVTGMSASSSYRGHIALQDTVGNTRVISTDSWVTAAVPDTTAPSFTAGPTGSGQTSSAFNVGFTSDETGQYRIVVVLASATAPSAADVLAGLGAGGSVPASVSPLSSMTAGVPVSVSMTGLSPSTPYRAYVALVDASNNTRRGNTNAITTADAPDVIAPNLLAGITISNISQAAALFSATPNESGAYGIAVLPSAAAAPSAAVILAGTAGGPYSLPQTVMTVNTLIQRNMTGLQPATSYKAHIGMRDAAGNTRVVSSDTFVTSAAVNTGIRRTIRHSKTEALLANLTGLKLLIRPAFRSNTELYYTETGTTDTNGVLSIASQNIGPVGTQLYVDVESQDGQFLGKWKVQVIDLDG